MKNQTVKSFATSSANKLHENALSLAINDDSVKEKTLQNFATIERQLRLVAKMSAQAIDVVLRDCPNFQFKRIAELSEAESREFYKRLRTSAEFIASGAKADRAIASLALDVQQNGLKARYTLRKLQSIFGHSTLTQARYFARFVEILGIGTYTRDKENSRVDLKESAFLDKLLK